MKGSVTMIGFGSAPTRGWQKQTLEGRIKRLIGAGMPPDEKQLRAWPEKVGLSEFLVTTQSSTELAYAAARIACLDAKRRFPDFNMDEVGLVLSGGASVDRLYPSTACIVQEALGIPKGAAQAVDLLSACASFGEALHIANALMRFYKVKYAVLAFGETIFSSVADYEGPQDVSWCLWGDGGGAVVLRYDVAGSAKEGILMSRSMSDGEFSHYTCSKGLGVLAHPGEARNPSMGDYAGALQRYLLGNMPPFVDWCIDSLKLNGKVDIFIPHAANRHVGRFIGNKIGVPEDRVLSRIETRGNTSSASIPITLAYYAEQNYFEPGELVVVNSYGGGMAATCMIYRWPTWLKRVSTPATPDEEWWMSLAA